MRVGELIEARYRIERLLGEGGMGSVYLAIDTALDKQVALKTLLPKMLSDLRAVEQLKREVRISQQLRHENICATYDFRMSSEYPFLVMEYVDGEALTNFIFRQPGHKCDEPGFQHLAAQILAAVGAAHRNGVIHRDLKSGNIMVKPDGSVRVMDFGIAANLKETFSRTTGTPVSLSIHYASPEQINGEDPCVSMDIYSLGCVFYEMLSGHPPFRQGDILHQQLTRQAQPIPEVEARLNDVVLACLLKDPAKRPQSTRDIETALTAKPSKIHVPRLAWPARSAPAVQAPRPPAAVATPMATTKVSRVHAPAPTAGPKVKGPVPWIWGSAALLVVVGGVILFSPSHDAASHAQKADPVPVQMSPVAPTPEKAEVPVPPPAPAAERPKSEDRAPDHSGEIRAGLAQAFAAYNAGDYQEAVKRYQGVLALDRNNGQAASGLADARSAWNTEDLTKAKQLFDTGQYDDAIGVFNAILARDPRNAPARKGIADARSAKDAEARAFGNR